jgi:predicted GNAT family acetyltransferase
MRHGATFVLEVDRQVVALGKLMPAGRYGYIRDVYTLPKCRRRGYARALVEGLLCVVSEVGRDACLCVAEGNLAALELYESLGFVPWGGRLHLVLSPGGGHLSLEPGAGNPTDHRREERLV